MTGQYQVLPAVEDSPGPPPAARRGATRTHVRPQVVSAASWTSGIRGFLFGVGFLVILTASVIDIAQFVQSHRSDAPNSIPSPASSQAQESTSTVAPVVTPPLTAEYTSVEGVSPDGLVVPGASSYVVTKGDVLYGIAVKHGTTVQALLDLNHITDPNLIEVGQVILLPAPDLPR